MDSASLLVFVILRVTTVLLLLKRPAFQSTSLFKCFRPHNSENISANQCNDQWPSVLSFMAINLNGCDTQVLTNEPTSASSSTRD